MSNRKTINQAVYSFVLLATVFTLSHSKCVNSTQFKYDLTEVSSVTGYHAVCSQHSGRTCCSRDNFQQLSRRISRVLGSSELSFQCKRSLTNLLCMPCDGDIGQQLREGVCSIYCEQLFTHCSQDYFSIDSNNQLRGCREQDIICSKLQDIINRKGPETVCQLFQHELTHMNCWNGEISAILKGKIQSKEKTQKKFTKKTAQPKQNSKYQEIKKQRAKKANTQQNKKQVPETINWIGQMKNYISLLGFFVIFFVGLYLKKIYKKWKKQYRNRR